MTALQIASLKRVGGGGQKIVLLDRYGPSARAVAKELARKGYSQVYTVQGEGEGMRCRRSPRGSFQLKSGGFKANMHIKVLVVGLLIDTLCPRPLIATFSMTSLTASHPSASALPLTLPLP